jgi:cytoskeletal protein CcmA (bactofilin family)
MWNRRKEEETVTNTVPSPTRTIEPVREGIPMSPISSRAPEPVEVHRGGTAMIGKSVIIKGQIFSREDLTIDGEVEGTVELQEHRLTIGPNGKVSASVKARELVVLGTIQGNVETTDKIDIRKDAKLLGDIKTARIVIEDGAYFKGNIDIVRAPSVPAAKPPQPVAVKPAEPAKAVGAGEGQR